jgi:hypothetical protein
LQQVTAKATSAEDKDLLLLGSLVVVSSYLPKTLGKYEERRVYPNLFLFLTVSASAGKGRLTLCRKLVYPIHKALREQYKVLYDAYKQEKAMFNSAKKDQPAADEPQEPPMLALLMPANSSATAFFQILNDNNGAGLMFETEGDTLAQTFKSEHGNFSDDFRKAFHHETISYLRRKDREVVKLENPRLSALLSGTPKQVSVLIPNAENGLFSRFIFYFMNIKPIWKDVFANSGDQTLDLYFKDLGEYFYCFHNQLKQQQEMRFCLTASQQQAFNVYFAQVQVQFLALYGDDYIATVRRLGLITFRIVDSNGVAANGKPRLYNAFNMHRYRFQHRVGNGKNPCAAPPQRFSMRCLPRRKRRQTTIPEWHCFNLCRRSSTSKLTVSLLRNCKSPKAHRQQVANEICKQQFVD